MKVAGQSGLDARSLDWRAADMLRLQILSGAFPPGHRLTETVLAHELDVSRGTVRAALRSLTYEGLVAQVAYSKWLVPELTPEDANEITTLHAALTGLAARLAAETGIVGPGEDRDMPIRLADAARMPRLSEQLQVIGRQIQRYQAALALTAVGSEDWSPCLAAISARDAAEAESLARALIVARHRPLLERLKSGTTALNNKTGGNHHD